MRRPGPGNSVRVRVSSSGSSLRGGVACVAGGSGDGRPQDAAVRLGDDAGVGPERSGEGPPRALLSALRPGDGGHHPGLGAAGGHPDDAGQQPLAGRQRAGPAALSGFGRRDVLRGFRPPFPERLAFGVGRRGSGLQPCGGRGGLCGGGSREQAGGAAARRAGPAPPPGGFAAGRPPGRTAGARVGILRGKAAHGQRIQGEPQGYFFVRPLIRPST